MKKVLILTVMISALSLADDIKELKYNTGYAGGHGLADPHDAGPHNNAKHRHAIVRQAGKGRGSSPKQKECNPRKGKAC